MNFSNLKPDGYAGINNKSPVNAGAQQPMGMEAIQRLVGESIAERSQKWQANKEKKQQEAQRIKEQKEMANQELTFKPHINRPKRAAGGNA